MGAICKIALYTIRRYGKVTLVMLFLGFLFLITTSNAYTQLHKELTTPYTLSGTVTGQADLEKYQGVHCLEATTPVISFDTVLKRQEAFLSGTVTAVLAEYPNLSFTQGNIFPNESNMPFLVMNQYAVEHFLTENKSYVTLTVNDTVTMTMGEEEHAAIICGIFEDGLEQPVIYMGYTLAARILRKGDSINLLFRLGKTADLESGAKALKKLGISISYDESLPERWQLTKQQIYQTAISSMVLLLCSAVQMAGRHKLAQIEASPERQALLLSGLNETQVYSVSLLRLFFAQLFCFLTAIALAALLGSISILGLLIGTILLTVHFGVIVWILMPKISERKVKKYEFA